MAKRAVPEEWADFARALGIRLQQARARTGHTQEQIAYRAGLTRSAYQYLERGLGRTATPANPTLLTLVALSQALGTDLCEILPDTAPDVTPS